MSEFFRFPHTPHLAWLGQGKPRADKVLSEDEAREMLEGEVTVEEKVDGANLGFSVSDDGVLRAQNRGAYLSLDEAAGQWKPLGRWLEPRKYDLADALFPNLMLFGEWCYAKHSMSYTRLPDWFLAFDVFDRETNTFFSASRRDELLAGLGIESVPRLGRGVFDRAGLEALLAHSKLSDGPAEGLYVRREEEDVLVSRAKLVRAEFVQAIEEHWSKRAITPNRLAGRSRAGES